MYTDVLPELGFLLSKGHHGIKKDMWVGCLIELIIRKEAARWYRLAVSWVLIELEED
jgi:hypothetical protein